MRVDRALVNEKAKKIKLLLLDVDGVMTDGGIILDSSGGEIKAFNEKDGHGIKLLMRAGVEVGILSGRESPVVTRRAEELGISLVKQRSLNKAGTFREILEERSLKEEEVAYIGDDLTDLPVLRKAGLSAAVADAVEEVKKEVDYITTQPGGKGAVRELIELLLKSQDKWDMVTQRYYQD